MYRLLALDMDGTLLNSRKEISEPTYQILKRADQKGCKICLSTGRGLAELQDYEDRYDMLSYGILISGSCIYDFKKQETIYSRPIEKKFLRQILEKIRGKDVMLHILNDHASYEQEDQMDHLEDYHMEAYRPMYERVVTKVKDMGITLLDPEIPVHKLNLYHRTVEDRQKTLESLQDLPLTLAFSEETSLEITPQGIDKGAGLRWLAERLRIPMEETAAAGDADNDLPILQAAGLAVAMGNANDNVRALADRMTADNDHDGVAEFVRKVILEDRAEPEG